MRKGWQSVSLEAKGTVLKGSINGVVVTTVTDSARANGYAGLFCGWHVPYAKSFSVAAFRLTLPSTPNACSHAHA